MRFIIFVIFFVIHNQFCLSDRQEMYSLLKTELVKKNDYQKEKEKRIGVLKKNVDEDLSYKDQVYINEQLYYEYEKYQIDSAIYYVKKNIDIATEIKNTTTLNKSLLQIVPLYSTRGFYIEALDILKQFDHITLNLEQKRLYYKGYSLLYRHYAQSSGFSQTLEKSIIYKDSLISILDATSLTYKTECIQRDLQELKNIETNKELLLNILDELNRYSQDYALIAYLIGLSYEIQGNKELEIKYYVLSAISDLKNGIKDNASMQSLAKIIYDDGNGDLDLAYLVNRSSLEDAIYCNVRYRTIDSSNTYPIITRAYQQKESQQNLTLKIALLFIIILSVILILSLIYVYKQMKRIARIRKIVDTTNENLKHSNKNLQSTNNELKEANLIKEKYIAYSFDLCSNYINKIEKLKSQLNAKLKTKQLDELSKMLESNEFFGNELKEFYNNFDTMFLGIYPNFVENVQSLLIDPEDLRTKSNELLSPELRIFALIRLGVKNSNKIAEYLHYSTSTIHNYKTKIRKKTRIPKEQLEDEIMKIGM